VGGTPRICLSQRPVCVRRTGRRRERRETSYRPHSTNHTPQTPTMKSMKDFKSSKGENVGKAVSRRGAENAEGAQGQDLAAATMKGTNCTKGRGVHKRALAETLRTQRNNLQTTLHHPHTRDPHHEGHELHEGDKRLEVASR